MYTVKAEIKHNGQVYKAGQTIDMSPEQAEALVASGVLESCEAEVASDQESTPAPLEGASDSVENETPTVPSPEQPTQEQDQIQTVTPVEESPTPSPETIVQPTASQIAQDLALEDSSNEEPNLDIQ